MAKRKKGSMYWYGDKVALYDAFPTKSGAQRLAHDLRSTCAASVRKLRPAQDGGRLKYGVFIPRSCMKLV